MFDHIPLNNFEDFIHVEWFGEKGIRPEFFSPLFMGVGLRHDDAGFFRIALFNIGEQVETVHLGQIGFGNDNVSIAVAPDVFPGFIPAFKSLD